MKHQMMALILLAAVGQSVASDATAPADSSTFMEQREKLDATYLQYEGVVAAAQAEQKRQVVEYNKQVVAVASQMKEQQEMIDKGKALLAGQDLQIAK